MWFAINVKEGFEQQACLWLQGVSAVAGVQELFVPLAEVRVRGGFDGAIGVGEAGAGTAAEVTFVPLLPGRVLAVAPSRREVRAAVRRARELDGVISREHSFDELNADEAAFVEALVSPEKHVAAFSEGRVLAGGCVVVDRGPLVGREHLIRKVDHRRKLAYVRVRVAGREVTAVLGLRLVREREAVA